MSFSASYFSMYIHRTVTLSDLSHRINVHCHARVMQHSYALAMDEANHATECVGMKQKLCACRLGGAETQGIMMIPSTQHTAQSCFLHTLNLPWSTENFPSPFRCTCTQGNLIRKNRSFSPCVVLFFHVIFHPSLLVQVCAGRYVEVHCTAQGP
jgi:hypothetical protein